MIIDTHEANGINAIPVARLETREEIIAAYGAVVEVMGPDHPLLSADALGTSLSVAMLAEDPTMVKVKVTGSHAEDLVASLETVAGFEDGNFRNPARYMLRKAGLPASPVEPCNDAILPITPAVVEEFAGVATPIIPAPTLSPKLVVLHSHEHRNAATQAVIDFAPSNKARNRVINALYKDMKDPFCPNPSSYTGAVSSLIFECLDKSAQHPDTLFGPIAKLMMDTSIEPSELTQPQSNQLNPAMLLKSLVDHAHSWWPSVLHEAPLLHQSH